MNVRILVPPLLVAFTLASPLAGAQAYPTDQSDVRYRCPVRWAKQQQEIDGFGVSAAFHQAENLRRFPPEQQQQVLDLLFSQSNGAGFSIVRNLIGDGGEIGGGKMWGKAIDGPTPTIEPREGVWNWTGDEGQIWFMREAAKRGCTRFVSTSWSPPAWMKTNQSVIEGGRLRRDKYQAFAEYLAAYVRGYREHHGIEIYALSPQNEPDEITKYSSCEWMGEEFHDFLKQALIPTFQREGIAAKLILGEQSRWTDAVALPALRDPEVAAHVDIVASHAYARANNAQAPLLSRSGVFVLPSRLGKRIWQTEVSAFDANDPRIGDGIYWAELIHCQLVQGGVSAWFYWWGIAYPPSKSTLVHLDMDRMVWTTSKRLYTIGNYARFIRPGSHRVEAESNPAPEVFVSAYVDPAAHRRLIVAINGNAEPCPLLFPKAAQPGDSITAYRTSDRESLAQVDAPAAAEGDLETTLAPESVTTFVLQP